MAVTVQAGASARAVTSAAEVDLLGVVVAGAPAFNAAGVALAGATRWTLKVTTDQDITVRVYSAAGANTGLSILSALTSAVTSAAPLTLSGDGESANVLRVTAQAAATTAAANADFRAVSP
jgi:hypothetical protein